MEIYHQYVKLRRQFGRWPRVADEHAEMIADVRPNEEHAAAYVERSPVTTCAQVIPDMSEHEANTNEVLYSKHNINHEEGGWPKDVDYTEAEHTIRFRKKVEKDEPPQSSYDYKTLPCLQVHVPRSGRCRAR